MIPNYLHINRVCQKCVVNKWTNRMAAFGEINLILCCALHQHFRHSRYRRTNLAVNIHHEDTFHHMKIIIIIIRHLVGWNWHRRPPIEIRSIINLLKRKFSYVDI